MKQGLILKFCLLAFLLVSVIGCGGGTTIILPPEEAKVVQTTTGIPAEYEAINNNPDIIEGKGSKISRDMQIAVNKANLQAASEIANFMNSKAVSLRESITREDVDNEDFESMYKETMSQAASQVVQGAKETFRKIIPEGDKYRAYVILQIPIGTANKAVLQSLKRNEEIWRMFKDSEQVKEMERKVKEFEESQKQG